MTTTTSLRNLTLADFKVPALLVLLSLVPIAGGVMRFLSMSDEAKLTHENARFVASPVPIAIHLIAAMLFCLLGAFQFSPGVRLRFAGLHRGAGRVIVLCGLVAAATGLWMTVFYTIPTYHQGSILYGARVLVGTAMIACLYLGWSSIMRRQVARHEAFMIRAYALGQGAGTQVLVLLPWMLISGESEGLTRDLLMTLSWAINVGVAEWIIHMRGVRAHAPNPVSAKVARQTKGAFS